MKKLFTLTAVLAVAILFSFTACGNENENGEIGTGTEVGRGSSDDGDRISLIPPSDMEMPEISESTQALIDMIANKTVVATVDGLDITAGQMVPWIGEAEMMLFAREEILENVWKNESYVLERTVDVHAARLRKKLEEYGAYITNRSGYGYAFDSERIYAYENHV